MNNNEPKMGLRVVLAVFLSFLVILFVNIFFRPQPVENKNPTQDTFVKDEQKEIKKEVEKNVNKLPNPQKEEKIKEERTSLETDKYIIEFSNKGAIITKIYSKEFLWNNQPIELTPFIDESNGPLFLSLGDYTPIFYNFEKKNNSLLFYTENNVLKIEKEYNFSNEYTINITIRIYNKTKSNIITKIFLLWGQGLGPIIEDDKRTRYDEEIVTSYFDVDKNSEVKIDKSIEEIKKVDWVSIDNRYFIAAIIPLKSDSYIVRINNNGLYKEEIGLGKEININENSSYNTSYDIYIGPKNEKFLKKIRNLDAITERGFAPIILISKWIKSLLFFLNSLFNNFGISIIFLSLIFNIILNPLSRKSMEASKKMQALQPQVEALKKKYKDPKELNAKIWELYKREKVSPTSGCLPIILQLPFFFALYAVLPYVIELKNTTFLWIKDLSSPDTVLYIESFKNVPILPYRLNILPIILTVISFFQTKISQGGHANTGQGKLMEFIMPIVFLFIFWNMPSGLVLYWIIQTIFTIIVQYIINHRKKIKSKKEVKK
ncbi:MAG TPA: membrane protein insertase YidC [Spirochaetota bacterium]|nr:membrane protein insertase YidC [Spirochaetota bacterium]HOM38823.1 membrane protein insertase YidC [Spirochaetota bacterium]HPQ49881.1 membrane protein insertase YidC [Spirochaetota bacterium]